MKYIQCPKCGYKLEDIATNKGEGEEISEAKMACPKCKTLMSMGIREEN